MSLIFDRMLAYRIFVFVSFVLFFSVAHAQERDVTVKIGYVNIRSIMDQAPQIEQIQQSLSREFEVERQAIISLRNHIAALSNQYDQNAIVLDEAQQADLQKQIDDGQLELTRNQQQLQDTYNLKRNEALAKLQSLIVNMVAKVSKERQLDIVLNNTGVVYVNSRIDITADVMSYLSEQVID